jgi:twitching motility two-component system response regulator PilH
LARKILLADDSVTAQNMGRKILADAGYEVLTVNNGSAALKKIAEAKPELIVLDVYMPGYSGLEVCQRLKESQETARIPILLTVGKLEPFKPEEARRVRADAFIVKPFEASELLSALSKLEDKMVPRSESSKPGRFARANAAIEESRPDRTVSIEEDSGWKNRIAFPSKKKKSEEEPAAAADDPAIYNAVNKDLRTVVDHTASIPAAPPQAEEEKVNVQALAPEGLPKDVTPEEIAALAAAAAQVKGKVEESKSETLVDAGKTVETQAKSIAETASTSDVKSADAAEQKAADVTPSPADVMAAIVALEKDSAAAPGSDNGFGSHPSGDEPVTMAVATRSEQPATSSRWSAVAVTLAPEEAAISLELEMQQARGATAVAEAQTPAFTTAAAITESAVPEAPVASAESAATMSSELPENVAAALAQAGITLANAPEQTITPAAQPLETVHEAETNAVAEASAQPESTPEPTPVAAVEESSTSTIEPVVAEHIEQASEPAASAEASSQPEFAAASEPTAPLEAPISEQEVTPSASIESEISQESSDLQVSPVVTEPAETGSAKAGGVTDMAKRESEIAQTTAAAWATWRRIRESDRETYPTPLEKDEAAMAAAAGAEKAPEDATPAEPESAEIANIVDSVLADLRPKIVEEISRKLGKKK